MPTSCESRTWEDCPMCGGDGQVAHHPGSQNYYERVGQDTKIMAWPVVPCPTCAAHFAAIDAAVAVERERAAKVAEDCTGRECGYCSGCDIAVSIRRGEPKGERP
jgi:hypothetical protein